jgi:hypothetical protein
MAFLKVLSAGRQLNNQEILAEVNRDRSEEWEAYTLEDLLLDPRDVLCWLDEHYYEVIIWD